MNYLDIKIGDVATVERIFMREDLEKFAELSLDYNPVHLDEEYGKNSIFKGNIVHGILVASLISGTLSEKLPGNGTIYVEQDLSFVKPVYVGERCTASVRVLDKKDSKNIITLETKVYIGSEENLVIEGKAVVKKL